MVSRHRPLGDSGGSDDSSDGGGGDPSGPVPKDNGQADLSATADILINGIRAAVRQKTEMSADGLTVVRLLLTAEQVAGAFASDDGEAVMNIEGLATGCQNQHAGGSSAGCAEDASGSIDPSNRKWKQPAAAA
ncbi:hypothetical protein ACHHV8_13725 [Paenibacillus sp. TAB 01]|uniref:hypothetical protein n=1 Tax=Paenibacillus sp. TAB 01 TaxID=3368988 RepID=UPI003750F499